MSNVETHTTDRVAVLRVVESQPANSWGIPRQAAINCLPLADGGVEIRQAADLGPEEDQTVTVTDSNAVALARSILFAAGFKAIYIATEGPGGARVDLADGALAKNFKVAQ